MPSQHWWREPRRPLAELVLCGTGFAAAGGFLFWRDPDLLISDLPPVLAANAVVFWWGLQWGKALLQGTFLGAGLTMLLQAVMVYLQLALPIPLYDLLVGCLVSAILVAAAQRWLYREAEDRLLLLGWGPGCAEIARLVPETLGVVERDASLVPAGVRHLGPYQNLDQILTEHQPRRIVVGALDWSKWISPRSLLECRIRGAEVDAAADVFEELLQRIHFEALRPEDLLWLEALQVYGPVVALRAVYSNLIGVVLVALLGPVLLVTALAARLAAGRGPLFDHVECVGFRNIPFQLLKFRMTRADGEFTWMASVISTLRLTPLPQLLNLVRGEMALFGPSPVRAVLADRLEQMLPMYAGRFLVAPGLFSWARVNAEPEPVTAHTPWRLQEESKAMGYDLYYLKHGSPALDLEILTQRLIGVRPVGRPQ